MNDDALCSIHFCMTLCVRSVNQLHVRLNVALQLYWQWCRIHKSFEGTTKYWIHIYIIMCFFFRWNAHIGCMGMFEFTTTRVQILKRARVRICLCVRACCLCLCECVGFYVVCALFNTFFNSFRLCMVGFFYRCASINVAPNGDFVCVVKG